MQKQLKFRGKVQKRPNFRKHRSSHMNGEEHMYNFPTIFAGKLSLGGTIQIINEFSKNVPIFFV